jgi:hypothetical protein
MNIKSEINFIEKKLESIVNKIVKKEVDSFYSKKFNTKDLKEYQEDRYSPNIDLDFRYFFEELDNKENHCLYWFELETENKAIELNNSMNNYRLKKDSPNYRTVPATNKNEKSNVLYVGIRRGKQKPSNLSNIVGRINQHMGYYKVARTQGLQLVHYAKGLDFEITLNVVEFKDLKNPMYLNLIEKMVANKLEPLSGRH